MICCNSANTIDWGAIGSTITAVVAIVISIIALKRNTKLAKQNTQLSIRQSVFNLVKDKAHDCNIAWEDEPPFEMNDTSPHFLVATEIIVALDLIEKAFELFGENDNTLATYKSTYHYLYWKQLKPDIRGWVMHRTLEIAKRFGDVYNNQINRIHFSFKDYFESN